MWTICTVKFTIQWKERSSPQCQHAYGFLKANNLVKTCSSDIGKIIVINTKNDWDTLQIEISDDCNAFKFDYGDVLAKIIKWALSVFNCSVNIQTIYWERS